MGLRFRKSISLCKGVRLNFGKTGVSISAGVPGFRKTIHSSGKVTTSVGIPGTGIYYVDTKNLSKKNKENKSCKIQAEKYIPNGDIVREQQVSRARRDYEIDRCNGQQVQNLVNSQVNNTTKAGAEKPEEKTEYISGIEVVENNNLQEVTYGTINKIFENCDRAVDWMEIISNLSPSSDDINADTWLYLHKKAVKVFEGDIDTYLEIIKTVNPYDDLLDYAEKFEFGTDDGNSMEVELSLIDNGINHLSISEFEDYYSAIAIRVARDTFALLPIEKVTVCVLYDSKQLLKKCFERSKFHEKDLKGKDASDIIRELAK